MTNALEHPKPNQSFTQYPLVGPMRACKKKVLASMNQGSPEYKNIRIAR
jgi:hypothetical protein